MRSFAYGLYGNISILVGEGLVPSQFAGAHKGRGETLLQRFLNTLYDNFTSKIKKIYGKT